MRGQLPPLAIPPLSLVVLYIAAIVEKCDEQVLPTLYYFIGKDLAASISELGRITMARGIVQAAASPLAGILASTTKDRTLIVAIGCAIWGVATSAIAAATSVDAATAAAAVNGFGLALVVPTLTSLVADMAPPSRRGAAFGIMSMISSIGASFGVLGAFIFLYAPPFGLAGWRAALHSVALASLACAAAVRRHAVDPSVHAAPPPPSQPQQQKKGAQTPSKGTSEAWWPAVRAVLRVKSVQVIISQGCIGTMPWVSLSMLNLWLQLIGFTAAQAFVLGGAFSLGCNIGGAAGGVLGDAAAVRSPRHGRILINQASVAAGLPFSALIFKYLPMPFDSAHSIANGAPSLGVVALYFVALFAFGLCISWCGANNSALFADLVPENRRTHAYAFDRSFEGAVGACGAPLVGIAAERLFGFSGSLADAAEAAPAARAVAGRALSSAMFMCLAVPWAVCLALYCLLHLTYPADRVAAMKEAHGGEAVLEDGSESGSSGGAAAAAAAVAPRRRATTDA